MTQERQQDERLAAFTDVVLEGQAASKCSERPPLADTIEMLTRTFSPQPPPDHLRLKIKRAIAAEWRQQPLSLSQRLSKLFRQPGRRWVWATAATLVVVAVVAALLAPALSTQITGTATGGGGMVVLAALLVLGVILVVAWLLSRR